MRISDWSSDVCSSDLVDEDVALAGRHQIEVGHVLRHVDAVAQADRVLTAGTVIDDLRIERLPRVPFWIDHIYSPDHSAGASGSLIDERSEEHTSELQSLMRISYAVFCLKKKNDKSQLSQSVTYSKEKS